MSLIEGMDSLNPDHQREDFDEVAPDASAMIESMRAHGYTLPAAIADLIDNSVAAGARNVWLRFEWEGANSWIAVVDDGSGMNESELVDAMRLGSRSPLEERDPNDLGRFGLGLKTASFSQARRLTVVSRRSSGEACLRRWDLDYLARPDVRGWRLLRTPHRDTGKRAGMLDDSGLSAGTLVLLERLDRVMGTGSLQENDHDRQSHFLWQIDRVREHLAMVFHRFLAQKHSPLRIYLNSDQIAPWDPFLEQHPATQEIGSYSEKLPGHSQPVNVVGFVLPHRDRFASADAHHLAGGPGGWNARQGFYLYRGRRLIIAGDWLQLGWQKEEHFKLARIRVDIPNSMDHEWLIDVKKSTAAPPPALRRWLRALAQEVRQVARQVYAHRGKYGPRTAKLTKPERIWLSRPRAGGEFSYRINRAHALLRSLISSTSSTDRKVLEALFRLIEETVPVQQIWIDTADSQDGAALPFSSTASSELRSLIRLCHISQMRFNSSTPGQAWDALAASDVFQTDEAQAIIAQLRDE